MRIRSLKSVRKHRPHVHPPVSYTEESFRERDLRSPAQAKYEARNVKRTSKATVE